MKDKEDTKLYLIIYNDKIHQEQSKYPLIKAEFLIKLLYLKNSKLRLNELSYLHDKLAWVRPLEKISHKHDQ